MARIKNNLLTILVWCILANLMLNTLAEDDRRPIDTNVAGDTDGDNFTDAKIEWKQPTVLIVTLFRNKAHILPYFFSYLDQLEYPKNRISLW